MSEVPENDQLGAYTVQKDTPFLEYQHPFPLKEGPNVHPLQTKCRTGLECE